MFSKTILKSWTLQVSRINQLIESIGDDALLAETAPGRNTGIYLLGHLAAVHDGLFPLLGFGEKLYPQLNGIFIEAADKSGQELPSLAEVKKYWMEINDKLLDEFNVLEPEEWLSRHNAVSAADFAKEPYRNKLNVLVTRIAHMSYHLGQLVYLKERK